MEFKLNNFTVEEVFAQSMGDDYVDWGLHAINAHKAWEKTKGKGIKVAVLDTGVDYQHPDLIQNLKQHVDFTNSAYGSMDVQGHGTHVAGIIAGVDNQIGMIGVAPEIDLYCAKVLGDTGTGSFDAILRGIRWAMAHEVDVINMSLGTGAEPPSQFHELIKEATNKGIIIVAATGNENGSVCWPAMYDEVLAVSAVDAQLHRASFSNYGIKNEICAPGVDILSTYKSKRYARLSGTSMATPIIAAAAALNLAYFTQQLGTKPTVEMVHTALTNATNDLGAVGKDEQYGAGIINLEKLI